jgi:hypothetical protein
MTTHSRHVAAVALGLLVTCCTGALAWDEAAAGPQPSQPLVEEVLLLLEERVSAAVIAEWLEMQATPVTPLTRDDLILLSRAAAPESLVQRLLELSKGEAKTPVQVPMPGSTTDAGVVVEFEIVYKPTWDDEVGEPDERDLFVYIDGEFLGRTGSQTGLISRPTLELRHALDPGPHTIRLLRELHEERGSKTAREWWHDSLVCPQAIEFEITRSGNWQVSISWTEPRFESKKKDPLNWSLSHDGELVGGESGIGTTRDDWPVLCEDFEANLEPGKKSSKKMKRVRESCLPWATLWPRGTTRTRAEIRADLERSDYKPVP